MLVADSQLWCHACKVVPNHGLFASSVSTCTVSTCRLDPLKRELSPVAGGKRTGFGVYKAEGVRGWLRRLSSLMILGLCVPGS